MKSKLLIPAAILLMGVSAGAWAADDDGAEATIRLMGTAEAERPDAVTKTITLPAHLMVEGDDQVASGREGEEGPRQGERAAGQAREGPGAGRSSPRAWRRDVRESEGKP